MANAFEFLFRVRYGECDAQGVVFNARYGDYVDLALTEYMRAAMGGYNALVNMGFETQVVRLLTEWKAPARFDDVLKASVYPSHFGNTSFTVNFDFVNASTQVLVATSQAHLCVGGCEKFHQADYSSPNKKRPARGRCGQADQSGWLTQTASE
jgi:acyl-CoA thioester hydrolase